MKVGLIFTTSTEKHALDQLIKESWIHISRDRENNIDIWSAGRVQLAITVSGSGRKRSGQATEALIHKGTQAIISAGHTAASDGYIQPGDIVVAERVELGGNRSSSIKASEALASAIPPDGAFEFSIHRAQLITTDPPLRPLDFSDTHTNPIALDSEAYAAGYICNARDIPFLAVKYVIETPNYNLPDEVASYLAAREQGGRFQTSLLNPRLWIGLYQLNNRIRYASRNLAEVLGMALVRFM